MFNFADAALDDTSIYYYFGEFGLVEFFVGQLDIFDPTTKKMTTRYDQAMDALGWEDSKFNTTYDF